MTLIKHAEEWLLRLQNLCTNMYTHTYTHVYTCMYIRIHLPMQIYTYMHVHKHTYTHTYTHTHTTCTYAHTQTRLEWQRCSDCARSWWDARSSACLFRLTQSNTFSTSNARTSLYPLPETQYPSTPHPLFSIYPKTVCGPRQARFFCSTLINTTECIALKTFRVVSQWPFV